MNISTPIQNSILNSKSPLQPKAPYRIHHLISMSNNQLKILEKKWQPNALE